MKIERFEDIKAWQPAREPAREVYALIRPKAFARGVVLKGPIQTAGPSMYNIAGGLDAEGNTAFVRFLRCARRSHTEVQSELHPAFDENCIRRDESRNVHDHAASTRAAIHGFIRYLESHQAKARGSESKVILLPNPKAPNSEQ